MKIELEAWWRVPQQARFLIAGGYNTLVGYLIFSALFLLVGQYVHYLVIGCVAHVISLANAFAVHRFLVFRSSDDWRRSFLRFNLSQLTALGCGLSGLYVLVNFAHLRPLVAQANVTILSVILSYLLHRHFSFRRTRMPGGR